MWRGYRKFGNYAYLTVLYEIPSVAITIALLIVYFYLTKKCNRPEDGS